MPHPILPEAQAFSDALMHLRYVALEFKQAALQAQNKMLVLQEVLMADPNSKIMAMDAGDIEAGFFRCAAQHGEVKRLHKLANDLGRRLNVAMPISPSYDHEYTELAKKSEEVKLSTPVRR